VDEVAADIEFSSPVAETLQYEVITNMAYLQQIDMKI
jgi:hypothetical protein